MDNTYRERVEKAVARLRQRVERGAPNRVTQVEVADRIRAWEIAHGLPPLKGQTAISHWVDGRWKIDPGRLSALEAVLDQLEGNAPPKEEKIIYKPGLSELPDDLAKDLAELRTTTSVPKVGRLPRRRSRKPTKTTPPKRIHIRQGEDGLSLTIDFRDTG